MYFYTNLFILFIKKKEKDTAKKLSEFYKQNYKAITNNGVYFILDVDYFIIRSSIIISVVIINNIGLS